jgi:acyl carrier protein
MKKEDFFSNLQDQLDIDSVKISEDTIFKNLEEWDSMTSMLLVGYISEAFNLDLNENDLKEITTVESLMKKIGEERFD